MKIYVFQLDCNNQFYTRDEVFGEHLEVANIMTLSLT